MSNLKPDGERCGFVTAIGIAQLVSWGTLFYSFPLIAEAMSAELAWSRTAIYGAASLGLFGGALLAYPVGILIDMGFGRRLMTGASLAASGVVVAWSTITEIYELYIVIFTLGMLQAALFYEPAFAVVAKQLGSLRARPAITAITLWAGFASTVFVPLLQLLLDTSGWRFALVALALINGLLAAPLYAWAVAPAPRAESTPVSQIAPPAATVQVNTLLRMPAFYFLTGSFCAYMALFSSFTYHLYPLLSAATVSTDQIVLAIALIGPSQVTARLLVHAFEDIAIKTIGIVAGLGFVLAMLLLLAPASFPVLASVCILYGAANGIFTIVRGMAVPELLSRDNYGRINGIMLIPMSITRALAPWLLAAYWTYSGSREPAIGAMLLMAVLVPLLLSIVKVHTKRHST